MTYYDVERPAPHRMDAVIAASLALASLAVMVVTYVPFMRIPVSVDGRWTVMRAGATAAEVLSGDLGSAEPGDLLAVDDRSVVRAGGGEPPAVLRLGSMLATDAQLYAGDRVTTRRGYDRIEDVESTVVAIPIPVEVEGSGPLLKMLAPGAAGARQVTRGVVSGHETSGTVLREPAPMRYLRVLPGGGARIVALTFDDGPWPGQTEKIISILDREKVPGTFFMLGTNVRKHPKLARRVVAHGHAVGNHSFSHKIKKDSPASMVRRELRGTNSLIRQATGITPKWYRPAGGALSGVIVAEARRADLRLVMWSVDPWDWDEPGAGNIARRVVAATKPGAVILLHDGGGDRGQTIKALPWIIHELKRKGYTFVTLDQMAALGTRPSPKIGGK
ncbi:MAG: hypothetical protein C0418_04205 [Coriobacteriaceae bacterium]|nr:hypothetical protein [Coriobacteriaceae bacterium]